MFKKPKKYFFFNWPSEGKLLEGLKIGIIIKIFIQKIFIKDWLNFLYGKTECKFEMHKI